MQLRYWIPFFDTTAQDWTPEARMTRWLTFVWIAVGLMVMFSASFPAGTTEFKNGWHYFQRQGINLAIGMVVFNWIVHSSLRNVLGYAQWGLLLFLGLILVTDLPGYTAIGGAARWIPLGPFLLQPSEFIKPFLVLQSARIFGQWDRLPWKTRLTWVGIFALVLVGILIQPNLSTASLCGITLWLVALAAGLPSIYLLGTAGVGMLLAALSIGLREYQRKRVMSFMNPWADPSGDGYQLTQSLMAVGSGGLFGTGYGQSAQKMGFLPIQYTDFIMAVFLEEFGLVGGICVLIMLIAYATLGFMIAQKATNVTHRLVAIGATVLMVGQSILNIAVATGAIPTTGLPFPFWSYGGSSVIASCVTAALLIRVARESGEVVNLPGVSTAVPSKVVSFPGAKPSGRFAAVFAAVFDRFNRQPKRSASPEKQPGQRRRRSR